MNVLSQVLALLRKLASSDGDVSVEESRWIRRLVSEFPEDTETDLEFEPAQLKKLVETHGDIEELLRVMLMLSLADGQTSTTEWELIQETAQLLDYPEDQLEALRSVTVLSAEPYE